MALNTNFTAGQVLTAAQQNNFPRGVAGYVKRTAGSVSITTAKADITGATITFTAEAGRAYKVTFNATVTKNVAVGTVSFYIATGANVDQYEYLLEATATASGYVLCLSSVVTGLSAGSQTLKMRAVVANNTGTVFGTSTNPYSFIVEDIGIA
jgi:hypothetical protein